jgi:hypothetical protein
MRTVLGWLTFLAFTLPALAGCLDPTADPAAPLAEAPGGVLPDLADVPEPRFDLERTRLWWESFVRDHPYRHALTPTNVQASERIAEDLRAAGFETSVLYFVPQANVGSPAPAGIRTIVGWKEGSVEPERVVAWVSHYDSNQATVYAAYDDGSGNAVGVELARALGGYDNRKTLMAIFFDAEEIGLVASEAFVQQAMANADAKFDMVIGHDMVGINCPGHEWPMYQMVGENFAADLVPIEEALYADFLGLDVGLGEDATNCVVLLDIHDRNSDERNFKEAGIPILRMAGGRKAVDYPEYHKPGDTVEYVYDYVGGPENFEKGLEMVLRTSYWNVVTFDRLPSLG